MIGAMMAMSAAQTLSDAIGDLFGISSDITSHITTDLILLGITGIGYLFSLRKIKNEGLSFAVLLAFMVSIFIFGSDLLFQFERMKVVKLDGQFGFYILKKWLIRILYPVIGFIYDRCRRKFNYNAQIIYFMLNGKLNISFLSTCQ
jgi:hypothetical protein